MWAAPAPFSSLGSGGTATVVEPRKAHKCEACGADACWGFRNPNKRAGIENPYRWYCSAHKFKGEAWLEEITGRAEARRKQEAAAGGGKAAGGGLLFPELG